MREFIYNDIKIYVGKNDTNNTFLVNTFKDSGFTWFHLKDLPSSHLVIEKQVECLNKIEIQICANMVKYYSKFKKEWTKKYWVDMTCIDNVTTMSKPGLVNITESKKIKIKPDFKFNPNKFIYISTEN
tara:strand:- start:3442 stop:3825 length:384 start_codon:yes stop_codon:yes gene_type:complete